MIPALSITAHHAAFMLPDPERNLVLALVAQNENQALMAATEDLAPPWAERGYSQIILDMHTPDSGQKLMAILKEDRVAFAYGFAGVGAQFSLADGANLWTAAGVPFAALWHDHPCYNYRQHIVDSPYVVHCYHVLDHLEARQKYLPPKSSRSVLLTATDGAWWPSHVRPWAERERKILFAKTAFQPEIWAEDWKRHPGHLQEILWAMAEQAKKDRNIDLADAAQSLFKARGLATDDLDIFMGVVQEVDFYIRAWRSDRLARALLPHPAHIIGRGWEYLGGLPRKAEFFSPMPASDYMKQAETHRILANSNPLWRHGIHERANLGICIGAIILTDRTIRSDTLFAGLPNYIGFEWQDDIGDAIAMALRRADDDDADYLPTTEQMVTEQLLSGRPDYISQLLEAIKTTRHYAAIGGA